MSRIERPSLWIWAALVAFFVGLWAPLGQQTFLIWNWMKLGVFAAPLIVAVGLAVREGAETGWLKDPKVWALGLLAAYLVHQGEEHWVDLLGHHYAFYAEANAILNDVLEPALKTSKPLTPASIFVVNTSLVWLVGLIAVASRRGRAFPLLALNGITLVNGVAHVAAALLLRSYNPGLGTAVALFLPMGALVYRVVLARGPHLKAVVVASVIWAVLAHLLLVGGALATSGMGWAPQPVYWAGLVVWSLLPMVLFPRAEFSLRDSAPAAAAVTVKFGEGAVG